MTRRHALAVLVALTTASTVAYASKPPTTRKPADEIVAATCTDVAGTVQRLSNVTILAGKDDSPYLPLVQSKTEPKPVPLASVDRVELLGPPRGKTGNAAVRLWRVGASSPTEEVMSTRSPNGESGAPIYLISKSQLLSKGGRAADGVPLLQCKVTKFKKFAI